MNEESNQMQVYVVIGGWDYEGESLSSLKLFDCKSTAEMYSKDLEFGENDSGLNVYQYSFDYVKMQLQNVLMQSKV